MRPIKLLFLSFAALFFCSCQNVASLISLEIKTIDYKKVSEQKIEDRTRAVNTKYPFTAVELDLSDSAKVAAGQTVKILAQRLPDFTDISFKKPKRLLAYHPSAQYLLEMPDGKRVWGVLPEAAIGIKAFYSETQDTVLITDVVRTSKPTKESRYPYIYKAGKASYTFEELGWGLKNQIYYYQHHIDLTPKEESWASKILEWKARNPFFKALNGHDTFYQYPRFASINTRWMTNGWHIFFMIANLIIVAILYLFFIFYITNIFTRILRHTIFRIESMGNGAVLTLSRLLVLLFFLSTVYFLGMIDLFLIIVFYSAWDDIRIEIEMSRCPYCHSVDKLKFLEDSDRQTTVSHSNTTSRDVRIDQKHSEYTQSDGTRVHLTTNIMQRQSFRDRITHRRWKENYYCTSCNRKISYSKSETSHHEERVG